jgi:hypothetical protein
VTRANVGDERFGRHAGFLGGQHDRRAMGVVGGHEMHFVAHHALRARPDIGLDVAKHVAQVQRTVGVRQGVGNEQATWHGFDDGDSAAG